jgi:putative long chain acyl-CoA synthase
MEQIDPNRVKLPAWYRPNPGKASDLAYILFTGEGENVRMSRITNRRWATSAFGTASSAALGDGDTVYSVTPLYHPSGLMMSVGGAIAGGARLAMASTFEPAMFWDEVRRYGVTVASYTWTLLHDLVEAPPHPGERHHPVRLFIGSGMPRGLWRRVQERFRPARVVEFYASTETGTVLVNLRDAKPGAMGRPLPGTPEVRLAAYDPESEDLVLGKGGFVRRCAADEIGILLARANASGGMLTPMRGVFSRDDAWLSTGDLFRQDEDGDFWRLDSIRDVIHTEDGPVLPAPIRDALGDLPAVDLAVVYGVRPPRKPDEQVIAAVTLRDGHTLEAADITAALSILDSEQRPALVHIVDEIPVTTWFRPITRPLREAGMPKASSRHLVWRLTRDGVAYRRVQAPSSRGSRPTSAANGTKPAASGRAAGKQPRSRRR